MSGSAMARIVGIQTVIQFVIDFSASLIVARLLSPHELGAFSIALAAVMIAQTLRSAGINMFLVSAPELDQTRIRTALGLAMIASFGFALLIFAAAPLIAAFYRAAVIADVLRIVAFTYLLAPFQVLAHGLLNRALRFKAIMAATLAGAATSGGTAVALAFLGWGTLSMAYATLAGGIVSLGVMLASRPAGFVFRPALVHWRSISSFTGWVLGSTLLNQIGPRLNELFVGRSLGIAPAAFLDRAEMLPRMLWNYAAPPVLSILAPLVAHEMRRGVDARTTLLLRMRLFGCIFSPIMIGIATQSAPILIGLYGWQWQASIAPAPWVCVAAAITGQFVVLGASLSGLGHARPLFLLSICEQGARVVMLAMLSRTDIVLVAIGTVGVSLVYAAAAIRLGARLKLFTVRDVLASLMPSIAICAVVAAAGIAIDMARGGGIPAHPIPAVIEAAAILAVVWIAALFVFQRSVITALWKLVRH
ncbi:oligosaccharide flippase family protein [Rhizorhabdus wittichii]|jgi:O-antigen/teichoic acid export membrane protein|nr:oligosaccharide flippase family protein [Rhizorhabdus wittichii]